MDALDSWFDSFTNTPVGAVIMFLAIFLMRVTIDDVRRRRDRSERDKKRRKAT